MSEPVRSLCVAVATGRIAAVFLEDGTVIGWQMKRFKARDTQNAAGIAKAWVNGFEPDHMLLEDTNAASRKGLSAQDAIKAVALVFAEAEGLDMRLPRTQLYQNKYDEAKALCVRYPEMKAVRPEQPPIWLPEPRQVTYFDALALHASLKA